MFSPEDQQIQICLMKANLDEIINDLARQRSMFPELDAENKQKCLERMTTLKTVRSLKTDVEKLKHENMSLTVKKLHLKSQLDEVSKALEKAKNDGEEIARSLKPEQAVIEYKTREYEDTLKEIAERFRSTHWYYNEEEVTAETNRVNGSIAQFETELYKKQYIVDELKKKADSIHPDIPENILEIVGKLDLDKKVKELTEKYDALDEYRKRLLL